MGQVQGDFESKRNFKVKGRFRGKVRFRII